MEFFQIVRKFPAEPQDIKWLKSFEVQSATIDFVIQLDAPFRRY